MKTYTEEEILKTFKSFRFSDNKTVHDFIVQDFLEALNIQSRQKTEELSERVTTPVNADAQSQGRVEREVVHRPHEAEVVGSNPTPAFTDAQTLCELPIKIVLSLKEEDAMTDYALTNLENTFDTYKVEYHLQKFTPREDESKT